ncbi:hypothetical protein B0H14DRAFT_2587708 [Mycena olivaceomarginata]|nr:hypothetical protein B0H14DRAFT_2587708 [Mycena olivaceomarginata]
MVNGKKEAQRKRNTGNKAHPDILDGEWSKAALAKLHRLDSAMGESAWVSAIGGNALARRVKVDDFTLPNGLAVPKNSTIGVSMDGIHFDEEYYDRPTEALASDEPRVNVDLVTISVHWLPFSHVVSFSFFFCPGRFFPANNVKMILAQLLFDYEIEPFAARPPNFAIGDMSVVPVDATMVIRKRELKRSCFSLISAIEIICAAMHFIESFLIKCF